MAVSMDYIKGGEVLIAPRLDYKYQYLLKCSECGECYCLLGPFISHCASHYQRESSVEEKCPELESSYVEVKYDGEHADEEDEKEPVEGIELKIEPLGYTNAESEVNIKD